MFKVTVTKEHIVQAIDEHDRSDTPYVSDCCPLNMALRPYYPDRRLIVGECVFDVGGRGVNFVPRLPSLLYYRANWGNALKEALNGTEFTFTIEDNINDLSMP